MAAFFKKNHSVITGLLVVAIAISLSYYLTGLKKSKYSPSSFVSLSIKWGTGDSLQNSYDSASGIYTYLDRQNRLAGKRAPLRANEIIFLDSKFNELSFWSLPGVVVNKGSNMKDPNVVRFEINIKYEKEDKRLIYQSNYHEDQDVAKRAAQLQACIITAIHQAEERYGP